MNRKNVFFFLIPQRNDPSDVVALRICGRFQFFYRKSANVCGKKWVRKSANQNLESAIYGLADLWNCPALKSIVRKTLPAAPVDNGHLLLDLNHLFLDCLASEPLCKSIFGSAVCILACGSTVGSLRSFFASPSLGRGWVASPLNQAASKIQTLQYALQSFKNNQGIVPKMKKPTFMQQ